MLLLISFPSRFLPLAVELNYLYAEVSTILLPLETLAGRCGDKTVSEIFVKEGKVRRE